MACPKHDRTQRLRQSNPGGDQHQAHQPHPEHSQQHRMQHRGQQTSPGLTPVPSSQGEAAEHPEVEPHHQKQQGHRQAAPGEERQTARQNSEGGGAKGFGLRQEGCPKAPLVNQATCEPETHVVPDGMVEPGTHHAQRDEDQQPGPGSPEAGRLRQGLQHVLQVLWRQPRQLNDGVRKMPGAERGIVMEPLPEPPQGLQEGQGHPDRRHAGQAGPQPGGRVLKGLTGVQEGPKVLSKGNGHHFFRKMASNSRKAMTSPSRFKGP